MATSSKQVRLDFEKLDVNGLKPIAKKFEKWGCKIADIEATNKGKRESGMLIKDFVFTTEDGQKMRCRVKGDGTIFQVKLNSKVKPIRNIDNIDKAIAEMIDYIADNADAYQKAQLQKQRRATRNKITPPAIRTTRLVQIEQKTKDLEQLNASVKQLEDQNAGFADSMKVKDEEIAKAQEDLDKELKRTEELTIAISEIKKELGMDKAA